MADVKPPAVDPQKATSVNPQGVQQARPRDAEVAAQTAKDTKDTKDESRSGEVQDGGVGGVRDALAASFQNRTVVPGRPGVDATLDNRAGAFAPLVEEWPAKPQQVDGPSASRQLAHTQATFEELKAEGERKGMYSPGPHGLSPESEREPETLYGTESLTPEQAANNG
jgi:hypothetical protein